MVEEATNQEVRVSKSDLREHEANVLSQVSGTKLSIFESGLNDNEQNRASEASGQNDSLVHTCLHRHTKDLLKASEQEVTIYLAWK